MIEHTIRIGRVILGIALLVAGVAMLVLPGPGILAIFVGITFLSHEFHWARRVQSWMKNRYEHLKGRIDGRSKDRLGKKLKEREKAEEDLFFEKQEQEKIARLKATQNAPVATAATTSPGQGKCPWCDTPLVHVKLHGIAVEQCPKDCGIWLPVGQVETLAQREHDGWLAKYFYRPRLDG